MTFKIALLNSLYGRFVCEYIHDHHDRLVGPSLDQRRAKTNATPEWGSIGWSFRKPHFGISSKLVKDVVPVFVAVGGLMFLYP
jgi:hypothetical protein